MEKELTSCALSVSIAEIATVPICAIKTNYQNTSSNSIWNTTRDIYRTRGILGFYQSSIASIASQVFSTTSKYVFYRKFLTFYEKENLTYADRVVCSLASGIPVTLITHPIDVVKVHLQMNDSIRKKISEKGLKCLYKGYSKTFTKIGMGSFMYFPLYDTIHSKMSKYIETNVAFTSSLATAVISVTLQHPIDYVKTRQMYGLPIYMGLNPLVYFKGIQLNMLRIVPHFMITMCCIDYFNSL